LRPIAAIVVAIIAVSLMEGLVQFGRNTLGRRT
jgi:hypothetical protein